MIKDILNKVSDNGYGALSDSEFEELKKYPKYKDVFNKIADNGYGALSDSEFEELKSIDKPSTYQFAPGQREDLMANLHEVGYSGLDDTQKALYKQQYDASDYAKAGHSFEEAQKLADESAGVGQPSLGNKIFNTAKNVYGLGRDVLSWPVAAGLSYLDALQTTKAGTDTNGNEISVPRWPNNPSYFERMGLSQQDLRESAQKGEGIEGVLSDPATAVQLGLAIGSVGTSIPAQALIGGIGGGISHAMNTENPTLSGTALSTGLGAGLGVGSAAIFGSPERRFIQRQIESQGIESQILPLESQIKALGDDITQNKVLYGTMGTGTGDIPGQRAKDVYESIIKPPKAKAIDEQLQMELLDDNVDTDVLRLLADDVERIRISDPIAAQYIAEAHGAIAQLDDKIKLGTRIGIDESELAKLKLQKSKLEDQLVERLNRPLYPIAYDAVKNSFVVNNPVKRAIIDNTFVGPAFDKFSQISTKKILPKVYGLTRGLGSIGATGTDRITEKIANNVSEDPMLKGIVNRSKRRINNKDKK